MRPLRLASATALLALGAALSSASCGEAYGGWGDGGCDTFCNRWVGAHCRTPVSRDECLQKCVTQRAQCPAQQQSLLRCANLEGAINCDADTGATKIANCSVQVGHVEGCLACAKFCDRWIAAGCSHARDRGECVASCLDARCADVHRFATTTCASAVLVCDDTGHPSSGDWGCGDALAMATLCAARAGGSHAFSWLPEKPPFDAGPTDAADTGADTPGPVDAFVGSDVGTFPQNGGP